MPSFRIVRCRGRWREELPASPWRPLLLPAWLAWRPIIGLRNRCYDARLLDQRRVPLPVISVGNLTAGGTGKTPVAMAVAAELARRGRRPWLLSRGYRGEADGRNDEARLAGDQPLICDPDRVRGALAAARAGADCVVLDDGFQHRRLARDLDLVVVDATRPWGRDDGGPGAVLPLGYLREGMRALRRAGLFWISRAELVDPPRRERLVAFLSRRAPVVVEPPPALALAPLSGDGAMPTASLAGRPVLLASGIGNPRGFELAAQRLGWRVVESRRYPDHHRYDAADAAGIAAAASAAGATVVVTAKDAVKLAPLLPPPGWLVLVAKPGDGALSAAPLAAALDEALAAGDRRRLASA